MPKLSLVPFLLALLFSATTAWACTGIQMKVDTVTLDAPVVTSGSPTATINFQQTYASTPLVFILPDNANSDPSTIRITSITTSSFTVGVSESQGEDGVTPSVDFTYLAIDPTGGAFTTPSGVTIEAGTVSTTSSVGKNDAVADAYDTINFTSGFAAAPAVLTELQTFANDPTFAFPGITSPWLEVAARNVTASNVQIALERAETSNGTVSLAETIAYVAIESTNASIAGSATVDFEAFNSADTVTDACTNVGNPNSADPNTFANIYASNPVVIANQIRRDGGDGGWALLCAESTSDVGLRIQEDLAGDTDTGHTTESLSVAVFSEPFFYDQGGRRMEVGRGSISAATTRSLGFTNVTFSNAFESTPLIFPMATIDGVPPAHLRIKNVTTTGFDIAQVEPVGEVGGHDSMDVDYIAVVPGTHQLPDMTVFEAGSLSTNATLAGSGSQTGPTTLTFANTFGATPALLMQVQSLSNEPGLDPSSPSSPWITTAVESVSGGSAQVGIERGETQAVEGVVALANEQLGYLIMDSGVNVTLPVIGSSTVDMQVFQTPINIAGVDDGCFTNNFPNGAFASAPRTIAHAVTRNGGNGVWTRRCSLSNSAIGLTIDEDRANDTERNHTNEGAAVWAFSDAFEWCAPELTVTKASSVEEDPVNGANPAVAKAIPSSKVRYTTTVENTSRVDASGLEIIEPVPANTLLFVGDYDGAGSPIDFDPGAGATASGLTLSFIDYASNSDDIDFTQDGGVDGYAYEPMPVDGYDSNITHIRLRPQGTFNGGDASNTTAFSASFQVEVQ